MQISLYIIRRIGQFCFPYGIQNQAGAFLSSSMSSCNFHNLQLHMWDMLSFAFLFSSQAQQCSAGSSQFSKRSYPSLLKKYRVLTDEWKINHKRVVHSGRAEWHWQNPAWKLILCLPVQYVVCRERCSPMISVPSRYDALSLYSLQQRCPVCMKENPQSEEMLLWSKIQVHM